MEGGRTYRQIMNFSFYPHIDTMQDPLAAQLFFKILLHKSNIRSPFRPETYFNHQAEKETSDNIMTASSTPLEEEITEEDICNHFGETEEEEDAAASTEPHLIDSSVDKGRRLSRQSYEWFQKETNLQVGLLPQEEVTRISRRRSSGLIGANGELRDDFIAKRQSINKPVLFQQLRSIPLLADLTAAKQIVEVDGSVLTQLIVSGYAKMSTKIDELNKINVFPIADGT